MLQRPPCPALRPFVRLLWASEEGSPGPGATSRERLLPSGDTHLALRLSAEPIRLFAGEADPTGVAAGHAVVGGARAAPYEKVAGSFATAGAVLEPGAAGALLGATAGELAGRHTGLAALWGEAAVSGLRERLLAAGSASARLDLLEAALLGRLRGRVRLLHPAVAEALVRLRASPRVGDAVARTGYSHRHLVALFRDAVGLAPKTYARVQRFQRALALLSGRDVPLGEVALRAGYADQAHLGREVRALSGVSPGAYRRAGPAQPNHLPLEVNSVQEPASPPR